MREEKICGESLRQLVETEKTKMREQVVAKRYKLNSVLEEGDNNKKAGEKRKRLDFGRMSNSDLKTEFFKQYYCKKY